MKYFRDNKPQQLIDFFFFSRILLLEFSPKRKEQFGSEVYAAREMSTLPLTVREFHDFCRYGTNHFRNNFFSYISKLLKLQTPSSKLKPFY